MTNRNIFSALLAASLFLFPELKTQAQSDTTFVVKGVIDTVPHATYFVRYRKGGDLIQDTIRLDAERRFEYTGTISEPTPFSLNIENTYNPNFPPFASVYSFWIEPGKRVSMTGKANWLVEGVYGPVVSGKLDLHTPTETEILNNNYNNRLTQTRKEWVERTGRALVDSEAALLRDSFTMDFIHRHTDAYYALVLLNNTIRFRNVDITKVEVALDRFPQRLRETHMAKDTEQRVLIKKLTGIGNVMPDFVQLDTLSNPVKLSDYRGKYLLIDFWAAWCGPCRKENPHLVEAHKRFGPKGFDILGISLDKSRARWLKAIQDDGLTWTQVSDLKGFDNAVAKQLFIHAIPDNFLLDPEGVIVARNLRGTEVIEKLEEIYASSAK